MLFCLILQHKMILVIVEFVHMYTLFFVSQFFAISTGSFLLYNVNNGDCVVPPSFASEELV